MSKRVLPALAFGIAGLIFAANSYQKTAPWEGMSQCELLSFALDRYGRSLEATSVERLLENGVALDSSLHQREIIITLVLRDQRGEEYGKSHYLDFNTWTGEIRERRSSESPESIRSRGLPPETCR